MPVRENLEREVMESDGDTTRLDRRSLVLRSAAGLTIPASLAMSGPSGVRAAARSTDDTSSPGMVESEGRVSAVRTGGFSKARLDRMHDVMAGHVESGYVPGLVTLVSRRGETHVEDIGQTAFEGGGPMRRDTIFRIASVTKPIVAAAAMILVEEAVLRLDDPLDPLLPELADRQILRRINGPLDDTVPANRPITLRDLLTFRLGYGAIFTPPDQSPLAQALIDAGVAAGPFLPALTPDEFMRVYNRLPLAHQPGKQWLDNTGADMLGVLISRATDMSRGEFLQERIFAPLGMRDTGFSVPASKLDRLAGSNWTNFETGELGVFDPAAGSRWASSPVFESGSGGLVSTADDLLTFGHQS